MPLFLNSKILSDESVCNHEKAVKTLDLIGKGTEQAFLDNELDHIVITIHKKPGKNGSRKKEEVKHNAFNYGALVTRFHVLPLLLPTVKG